jgi:O-antigen ligase
VREGLADLWIGAASLVGWSLALEPRRLERLLLGLLVPATLLAVLGILQFHGIYRPFGFEGPDYDPRLAMTSLAGNPGDLGAYLVLPCLIAQWAVFRRRGRSRILAAAALAVCLYAMALTQTLAALAALGLGSVLLWGRLLPRRRSVLLFGGGAVLALVLVLAVAPLRVRIANKAGQALAGDWNSVLTGRLDGWRAALWMFREHPWTGIGHGAYRPEYVPAIEDLMDRGVRTYPEHVLPVFANAHNEYLEAVAEWGILGIPVLAWGLWVLVASLRRARRAEDQALAWAGMAALAVLSLAYFPFRIALLAFPALLFLSWVLRSGEPAEREEAA